MRTFPPLSDACRLEHRVAEILTEQEIHGWTFDEQKGQQLESYLRGEMEWIELCLDMYVRGGIQWISKERQKK